MLFLFSISAFDFLFLLSANCIYRTIGTFFNATARLHLCVIHNIYCVVCIVYIAYDNKLYCNTQGWLTKYIKIYQIYFNILIVCYAFWGIKAIGRRNIRILRGLPKKTASGNARRQRLACGLGVMIPLESQRPV